MTDKKKFESWVSDLAKQFTLSLPIGNFIPMLWSSDEALDILDESWVQQVKEAEDVVSKFTDDELNSLVNQRGLAETLVLLLGWCRILFIRCSLYEQRLEKAQKVLGEVETVVISKMCQKAQCQKAQDQETQV